MGTASDLQIWAYPEEIELAGADRLAALVADLGFGALSLAVSYHQCQRVFPRHGAVRPGAAGALHFTPEPRRYGELVPLGATDPAGEAGIRSLRRACDDRGISFRVWLVVLDNELLAAANPEYAAQTLDGTPTRHALCPSRAAARSYAAGLVGDVVSRFSPDRIDLEAALYPRWNSYVAEIALDPLTPRAKHFGAQCLCSDCKALLRAADVDPPEAERALLAACGPPLGQTQSESPAPQLLAAMAAARDQGVARLLDEVSAKAGPSQLQLVGFGDPGALRLQGFGPQAIQSAGSALVGLGDTAAPALDSLLEGHLADRDPAQITIGLNWSAATGATLGDSAARALSRGIAGLSIYNLSLLTEPGLAEVRDAITSLALEPTQ